MHHKLCRSLARSIDDQNDPATHLAGDPASLEADQEPSRSCSQGSLARRKSTLRARRSETSYNAQVLLSNKIYAILPRAAVPDVHRKTLRQTTARSKSSPVRVSQEEQPTEATRRQRIPQCRYSHEYDFTNDPSAGSPTETLLRLLLPLDTMTDKSSPALRSMQQVQRARHRARSVEATGGVYKGQGQIRREMMTHAY